MEWISFLVCNRTLFFLTCRRFSKVILFHAIQYAIAVFLRHNFSSETCWFEFAHRFVQSLSCMLIRLLYSDVCLVCSYITILWLCAQNIFTAFYLETSRKVNELLCFCMNPPTDWYDMYSKIVYVAGNCSWLMESCCIESIFVLAQWVFDSSVGYWCFLSSNVVKVQVLRMCSVIITSLANDI